MPKNQDLLSLQAEVSKELKNDLPEAKQHEFGVVEEKKSVGPNQENLDKANEYSEMVNKYTNQLTKVKKLLMKGNKDKAVRSLEAPLVTLVYAAEKLQAIYSNDEITDNEKRRIPSLENIIKINLGKIKNFDEQFSAQVKEASRAEIDQLIEKAVSDKDDKVVEVARKEEKAEVATPISVGEAFQQKNQALLSEMERTDLMIEAKSAGVGGFFKSIFSKELRDLKKRRYELMVQMDESTDKTTRPSASRGHMAAQEASARLNRNIGISGQVGRIAEVTGDGPAGRRVKVAPTKPVTKTENNVDTNKITLEDRKAEVTEPISVGEAFKQKNQALLSEMEKTDQMIESKSAGVGGFFKSIFSKELRDLKKRRHELMVQMDESTDKTTRPSASRGHMAAQEASARLNRNIGISGQVGRIAEVTGDGPAGRTVEVAPTKPVANVDTKKITPEDKKEFAELLKRNEKLKKSLGAYVNDKQIGDKVAEVMGVQKVKEVPIEDQHLDNDDEDLKKFKRQQSGFRGFFKGLFGYNSKENIELEDSKNVYDEGAMGNVDPTKRRHITAGAKKKIDSDIRHSGRSPMVK